MPTRNSLLKRIEGVVARLPLDARAMAAGMGTAPSEGAAQFGSNFMPGIGDAVGLAQDAEMYLRDPSSRTPRNALLSGLGMLPFVPGMTKYYHGTTKAFDNFDLKAPKATGGGLNKYGVFLTPDPKVASRYAMDFGPEGANVRMVEFSPQKPLNLTAREYETLQRLVGKIDGGEGLNEVQKIGLEDLLAKYGADPSLHPMDALKRAGYDSIAKDAGRFGAAEPEILVFDIDRLR